MSEVVTITKDRFLEVCAEARHEVFGSQNTMEGLLNVIVTGAFVVKIAEKIFKEEENENVRN